MGFEAESELQDLIHNQPATLQEGIPEISPSLSSQAGHWVALGREVNIDGGRADNLFVDINGIVTIVECKRYCDPRLKRRVYSQIMNYAAGLRAQFRSCGEDAFADEFFELISSGGPEYCDWESFTEIVDALRKDEVLEKKNTDLWEKQFTQRLRQNIQRGVFRLIILCGPSSARSFKADHMTNLMELMSYSEQENDRYELLLMDIRRVRRTSTGNEDVLGDFRSRIVWRRHTSLPEVPAVHEAIRDTTEGIEKMNDRRQLVEKNNDAARERLKRFSEKLEDRGYTFKETTVGVKLYRDGSLYMHLAFDAERAEWALVRVQIRPNERIYHLCKAEMLEEKLEEQFDWYGDMEYESMDSSDTYRISLRPDYSHPINPELVEFLGA